MKARNPLRHRSHPVIAVLAASGIVVLLVAAGCATLNPSGRTPPPAPAPYSVPVPTAASASPTASPTASSTSSPSPSLQITPSPETPPPPAGSLPLVNSCNPSSVPDAIPVTAPASAEAGSFTLHVPVLMYHRIVPFAQAGNSIRSLVVPPATFAAQLEALDKAGWHTITMATLANDLQAHIRPPAKTFVITIDDGWADGYTYALPIMHDYGFVATYFVIAGRIDKPGFLTSADLQALVASGDEIGDHTMDHLRLAHQTSAKRTYEIDAAAARIAQVTGYWPESLAYPYGSVNSQVATAVAACQELRIAVLEGPLPIEEPAASQAPGASPKPRVTLKLQAYETWADRFEVPRIRVTPGTGPATLLADLG